MMESARLDAHFRSVLRTLHAHSPRRLSFAQQRARSRHLQRLDDYRRRGRFPRNRHFPGWVPHFVDADETRCAMGHLIELAGGADLVQYVARARNYDFVHELADIPEIVAWLEANGLTLDEAAAIQPTYCGPQSDNCLCLGLSDGYVAGSVSGGGTSTVLTVTAVYGAPGVSVGDELEVGFQPKPYDVTFARLNSVGQITQVPFGAVGDEVLIDRNTCEYPQVAEIPGPLPLDVVTDALSTGNQKDCRKVVERYDRDWAKQADGCEGCMCSSPLHGQTNAGGLVLVALAMGLYCARRYRRELAGPLR